MSKVIYRRKTCRLCKSKDIVCVLHLEPTPIGEGYIKESELKNKQDEYPVDLCLCKNCGNVQLADVINPDILYKNYTYKTTHSLNLDKHFDEYAKTILEKIHLEKESLIVDVGSNDGSLLKSFKKKHMRVIGVDPAIEIANDATHNGISTYKNYFNVETARMIQKENGKASVITTNNTFANIDNLDEILDGVRELLSPDGVFIYETGYVLDVIQKVIFDNIYHEHLNYFSVKSSKQFLERNGFELIDVMHTPTKGGSIRCFAQLRDGKREVQSSVDYFIRVESDFSLHNEETYKLFDENINRMKIIYCLLEALKQSGRKIIGYGASVTVTGILFNFMLDKNQIDFLVDDNSIRYNLYSPGKHIPVFPSEKIYDYKPDYIVILAWQYADVIIKKHKRYLDDGGSFIVFQPQLRVINRYNYE